MRHLAPPLRSCRWCVQSVELNFVDSCSRQFLRNKDNTWLTKAEPKLTLTSTVRASDGREGVGGMQGLPVAVAVALAHKDRAQSHAHAHCEDSSWRVEGGAAGLACDCGCGCGLCRGGGRGQSSGVSGAQHASDSAGKRPHEGPALPATQV